MAFDPISLEQLVKTYGFLTFIAGIIGWCFKQYYDFQTIKKNQQAGEQYLFTFQKKNEEELEKIRMKHEQEIYRLENKHELEMKKLDSRMSENAEKQFMRLQLVERDTENRLLKVQQEHSTKYENVNHKLEDLYKIVSKISTNFEHIAKTLDELKAAQNEQTKFNMELLKSRSNK